MTPISAYLLFSAPIALVYYLKYRTNVLLIFLAELCLLGIYILAVSWRDAVNVKKAPENIVEEYNNRIAKYKRRILKRKS